MDAAGLRRVQVRVPAAASSTGVKRRSEVDRRLDLLVRLPANLTYLFSPASLCLPHCMHGELGRCRDSLVRSSAASVKNLQFATYLCCYRGACWQWYGCGHGRATA